MTVKPMKSKNLLDKIKSRGHYKIRFIPDTPLDGVFLANMRYIDMYQFFINTVVSLRGWDYPHFPTSKVDNNFYRIIDGYESFTEFGYLKEVWRLMDSGQFVHYKAFCEDWGEDDNVLGTYQHVPPMRYFNIIDCIYVITEIFVFVRNLYNRGFYTENTSLLVSIELNKLQDRKIVHNDPRRAPILDNYVCRIPSFPYERRNIGSENAKQDYLNLATDCIVGILRVFNWTDFPVTSIRAIQNEILNRTY
jgi:hypothetical protein